MAERRNEIRRRKKRASAEERGAMSDPAATVAKSTDVAVSLESKTHVHEQAQGLRGENPANAYAKLCTGGESDFHSERREC